MKIKKNYKILFVEDDPEELKGFESFISDNKLNYIYTVVNSVSQAKHKLSKENFDIILADYIVADGTAFDILSLERDEPIIIITALGNEGVAAKALKEGAYEYLIKDPENNFLKILPQTIENAIKHKALEENLFLLSQAVEQGPAIIEITDAEGIIKYANNRFYDFTGYAKEDTLGNSPGFLKSGAMPRVEYKKLWQTILNGDEWKGEFYNRKKNGDYFWEYASIKPIRNSKGKITHFIKVAKDITNRKNTEKLLKETNEKYKELADYTPQTIFEADLEGDIVFMNRTGLEVFGYKDKDLNDGLNIFELFDKSDVSKLKEDLKELSNKSKFVFGEYQAVKKNGVIFPVATYSSPILGSGEIIGYRGIVVDITKIKQSEEKLRESEERFRKIVQNINEYIYSVTYKNGKAVTTYHSPKSYSVTGYYPNEYEEDKRLWFKMIYEEDRENVQEFLNNIQKKLIPGKIEHRIIRKDGEIRWVLNTTTISLDSEGKLQRVDGFILDISEQKTLLEKLEALSLIDELTGLYNRRGFITLAKQQLKLANRTKRKMFVLFIDMDNMKQINDVYGHLEGDNALKEISELLRKTFRDSDIIARIGGDEFVVLALSDMNVDDKFLIDRVNDAILKVNQSGENLFKLAVSIGKSCYNPDKPTPIEELIEKADDSMYRDKKSKKNPKK
ncbi:MAG TPA: PAS domain S-box protein [Spirochaetota bacterium]|nr:PAS domain S-box protein [Spirochaetota bacterium]